MSLTTFTTQNTPQLKPSEKLLFQKLFSIPLQRVICWDSVSVLSRATHIYWPKKFTYLLLKLNFKTGLDFVALFATIALVLCFKYENSVPLLSQLCSLHKANLQWTGLNPVSADRHVNTALVKLYHLDFCPECCAFIDNFVLDPYDSQLNEEHA